MTNRIRTLLSGTRALEARLADAVERAAATLVRPGAPSPLEVVDEVVDEIGSQVLPAGRGRFTFPFTDIGITFAAAAPHVQAHFEAICAGPPSLQDRVQRRLAAAGCVAVEPAIHLAFAPAAAAAWPRPEFAIAYARRDPAARRPAPQAAPRVDLTVIHGQAEHDSYAFTIWPIAIGRGAEVRDTRQQLLRVNHVAFREGGDAITQSVSRRHARIEFDAETQRLRLIDDNSAQGTSVIRGGRGIAVPRGSRGLGLQSGDEIVLGQARMRVTISCIDNR
jgi:hypothetical protein